MRARILGSCVPTGIGHAFAIQTGYVTSEETPKHSSECVQFGVFQFIHELSTRWRRRPLHAQLEQRRDRTIISLKLIQNRVPNGSAHAIFWSILSFDCVHPTVSLSGFNDCERELWFAQNRNTDKFGAKRIRDVATETVLIGDLSVLTPA